MSSSSEISGNLGLAVVHWSSNARSAKRFSLLSSSSFCTPWPFMLMSMSSDLPSSMTAFTRELTPSSVVEAGSPSILAICA